MSLHVLRRRFVNIISENYKTATCSLHRLDVSKHLFHPSSPATATAEASEAPPPPPAAISTLDSLPAPTLSFQPEPRRSTRTDQLFALVNPRSSESRILWSSPDGVTVVSDADTHCTHAMPNAGYKGHNPVAISVVPTRPRRPNEEADLYMLSTNCSRPSFQVLTFGGYKSPWQRLCFRDKPWEWESLPPPPFPRDCRIISHAVLDDGATICVTATSTDFSDSDFDEEEEEEEEDCKEEDSTLITCLFDTVKREWRQARDHLPFSGGAEYVPDLKLWLGLCRDKHELCTYNLANAAAAAAAAGEEPSAALKHLGQVVEMPKDWQSIKARLVNLGDGRFCIAKLIQEVLVPSDEDDDDDLALVASRVAVLALLTGVEMVRDGEAGGFKMVTHKSLSYVFGQDKIVCVL